MVDINTLLQQFIILLFGGIALFISAYQMGYNMCFKQHVYKEDEITETLENEITEILENEK